MPPPFDVHLTFLNFSQLHLVRNHWSRGCGLLSDSVLKICSLPVPRCLWGFPHSRVIWERHFDGTQLIMEIQMINCPVVLVVFLPRALSHISPPALKLHYLLLMCRFTTSYLHVGGSYVV